MPHRRVSSPREGQRIPAHGLRFSLNSIAAENNHRRTTCDERAIRTALKNGCKVAAVKSAGFSIKCSLSACPHLPGCMHDVVFHTTACSWGRIAPEVFDDELSQTPFLRRCRKAHGLSRKLAPLFTGLPLILDYSIQPLPLNAMLHRKVDIVLAVCQSGDHGNCAPRHYLGNEGNSSAVIVACFATNVETQVYLIEIDVKRNGETSEKLGAAEPKPDKAEVRSPME
jgi:hypothetical protein